MVNGRSVVDKGLFEMSLTRRIAAPPDVVFQAWIDAKQLAEWWGPKEFTNPVCWVDARLGGAILIHMRAPDGVVHVMTGRFVQIDWPHRLVFISAAIDDQGKPVFEVRNTVTFRQIRNGTEIALVAEVTKTTADAPRYLAGMSQGWSQSLERLIALVCANTDAKGRCYEAMAVATSGST